MKTFTIQGNYVVSFRVTPGSVDTLIFDKEHNRSTPVGQMIPNWAHAALDEIHELNQQIETLKEALNNG